MEDWQLDFEWLRVRHFVKDRFNRSDLPSVNSMLYLIGIQEANLNQRKYTKEEKQDLMHVATCHLLSIEGFFEYIGNDEDGWPHFKQVRVLPVEGLAAQEQFLKECIIKYFKTYIQEDQVVDHEA